MATKLIPVKWRIGRRANGEADNLDMHLNAVLQTMGITQRASHWMTANCECQVRDRVANLGTGAEYGAGACLMPEDVAETARDYFETIKPNMVFEVVSESEFETFHDERATLEQPAEKIDTVMLQGIQAQADLEKTVTGSVSAKTAARAARALDPDDPEPGVRKNPDKVFADRKKRLRGEINALKVAEILARVNP